jgi:aerobic carbon-monoxide dehydrogenase large subunit
VCTLRGPPGGAKQSFNDCDSGLRLVTDTGIKPIGATRYAGSRIHRVEDPRLLTGEGVYVDDVALPGMLHACFVRSPHARARILGIDTTGAAAVPGVEAVLVAADLNPGVHEQWHTMLGPDSPETPRPPLADGEVRFVGDPVALVLATNRYVAEDASDLVMVEYEPLPPVVDYTTAESSAELVHHSHGSNLIGSLTGPPAGPLEDVFASAAHVTEDTIYQQAQAAVPLETRGLVVRHFHGEVTIWAATQVPHEVRAFCARLLGIPEHRVRVIMKDTGGGFGQKVMVQREEMCLMLAALKVPAPLKWIEDRRENLMTAGQSRHEHGTVRMAFDEGGLIEAAQIDYTEDDGAYPTPWPVMVTYSVGGLFPGPYRVPRSSFATKAIYTNTAGRSAYRGPWVYESVARELLLDKAARQMGVDPIELRRRNLLRHEDMPYTNPNGMPFDAITPLENFERALDVLDYENFRREQAAARQEGRYLGVGTGSFVEPTTPGAGMYGTEGATIRIEPSGKVNVYLAGGSTGNSLETTAVQLTADALGVDIDDVSTIQGDTAVTGYGGGTGGSRSGSMIAGAIAETASGLRDRIVAIAAHRLEAAPEDLELAEGRCRVRGTPSLGLTLAEIARLAYFQPDALPDGVPPGLEASGRYKAVTRFNWANATHVCTCEVDVVTGHVQLLRYIVSENCGAMINPNIVEGQIAGGTVQGIAGALFEHLAYDEDGNPIATTFMDYLLPTAADVPIIEYAHLDTPGPGPGGYKGVGEGGVLGAVPAVLNAVGDALSPFGATITRLPLSPSAIVDLIAASGHA